MGISTQGFGSFSLTSSFNFHFTFRSFLIFLTCAFCYPRFSAFSSNI
jgi:hypothetical protein